MIQFIAFLELLKKKLFLKKILILYHLNNLLNLLIKINLKMIKKKDYLI